MVVDEDKRSVMARKSNLSSNMENMWRHKILIFGIGDLDKRSPREVDSIVWQVSRL